jgi:hypothetical protein
MVKVLMVQCFPNRWKITTEDGKVLAEDITVPAFKAEEYVRAWVSSFHCWTYEVIPLPKTEDKNVRRR